MIKILKKLYESRNFIKSLESWKRKFNVHLFRHNAFVINNIEGKELGKRE